MLGIDARTWFLAIDLFILAVSGGTAMFLYAKIRARPRDPFNRW